MVPSHPSDRAIEAVPRDPGLIADDGLPETAETVKQSGFADIRPAYNGDSKHGRGDPTRDSKCEPDENQGTKTAGGGSGGALR